MQQDSLVDTKSLKEVLTIITISKSLIKRNDLHGLPYICHLAEYTTQRSWYKAYKNAVNKVKTKYFLLIDDNDSLPEQLAVPDDEFGMVYGDYWVKEFKREFTRPIPLWHKPNTDHSPILLNRPILNTEKTKAILSVFNGDNVINSAVIYHLVNRLFKAQYNSKLKIVWNKDKTDSFYKYSKELINNTSSFIKSDISPILKAFKAKKEEDRLNRLTPISELSDKLTVVTLSKEPFTRDDIGDLQYVNYNSTFDSLSGFFLAIKAATRMVNTPYLVFVDVDDKIEDRLTLPNDDVGLVYGDFYLSVNDVVKRIYTGEFSEEVFATKPWMLHKPVLNTAKFRSVVEKMPLENLDIQSVLYYFVAKIYGAQYNEDLKLVWKKKIRVNPEARQKRRERNNRRIDIDSYRRQNSKQNSKELPDSDEPLHSKAFKVKDKSLTFIKENQEALIRSITGQPANPIEIT